MHYHEAANFLFGLRRFSVRPGTDSIEALLDHLENPEEELEFVQIAGSNGKGSTARIAESILRQGDRTVGLYTSPHLEDLSERVRVDGRPMSDDAIAAFVERTRPWLVDRAASGDPLTFFEVVTAMAIREFARRDVDVAVLEVGLGGEYDATSAVDPVAAAITNVSLEHTAILGDSIEEIARTKARIAGAGTPVVTACGGTALSVVREVIADVGGEIRTVDGPTVSDPDPDPDVTAAYHGRIETRSGRRSPTDSRIEVVGPGWEYDARLPLVGEYQATNAAIAVALAHATVARLEGGGDDGDPDDDGETGGDSTPTATAPIPDAAVTDGLATATWPGRFEVLGTDPLVILDGAHNPAACRTLSGTLAEYDYDELHLAFGAMHDKDHAGTIAALPTPASVHTCEPDHPRAEDPDVLAAAFDDVGIGDVTVEPAVADALEAAVERADPDDCVLLAGSLFAVAEGRARYTRRVVPKRTDSLADAETLLADADVADADRDRVRDGLVYRVLRTRLDPTRAETVRRAALGADVECAVSGVGPGGESIEVVLGGTVDRLRDLADAIDGSDHNGGHEGLPGLAETIRERAGIPEFEAADAADADRTDDAAGAGQAVDATDADWPWEEGPTVMGILNVTPDSFHDGGRHGTLEDAVDGARRMIDAGVGIIDVGGESTRPGADPVPVDDEIDRVVPAVEALRELPAVARGDVAISVDTRKPAVAEAALAAGADVINDVTGLEDPRMREVVAEAGCPVVVMHSLDAPVDPETVVEYEDVVDDVIAALRERILRAEAAGIDRENVIVDPGLGFAKSPTEEFEILSRVEEFAALECPVLIGHSHKSMFGSLGYDDDDRGAATVAGTAVAVERGADIVRVHDVAQNRAAVDVVTAVHDPDGVGGDE